MLEMLQATNQILKVVNPSVRVKRVDRDGSLHQTDNSSGIPVFSFVLDVVEIFLLVRGCRDFLG